MLAATPGAKYLLGNNVCDKLFQILGVFDVYVGTTSEDAVNHYCGVVLLIVGRICTTSLSENAADESVKGQAKSCNIIVRLPIMRTIVQTIVTWL